MPFMDLSNFRYGGEKVKSRPIEDIREQDKLRRSLETDMMALIQNAISNGLNPDKAKEAVKGVWLQELRLGKSRGNFKRSYG